MGKKRGMSECVSKERVGECNVSKCMNESVNMNE